MDESTFCAAAREWGEIGVAIPEIVFIFFATLVKMGGQHHQKKGQREPEHADDRQAKIWQAGKLYTW